MLKNNRKWKITENRHFRSFRSTECFSSQWFNCFSNIELGQSVNFSERYFVTLFFTFISTVWNSAILEILVTVVGGWIGEGLHILSNLLFFGGSLHLTGCIYQDSRMGSRRHYERRRMTTRAKLNASNHQRIHTYTHTSSYQILFISTLKFILKRIYRVQFAELSFIYSRVNVDVRLSAIKSRNFDIQESHQINREIGYLDKCRSYSV